MLFVRTIHALGLALALLSACASDTPALSEGDEGGTPEASVRDDATSGERPGQDASARDDAAASPDDAATGNPVHETGPAAQDAAASESGPEAGPSDAGLPSSSDADAGPLVVPNDSGGPAIKEPFAVGSHWNEISKYAALRAAGVQMIRIDLSWDEVEPTQGAYDWPKYKDALAEAAKQGIKVLAVLGYTPSWARSGDNHNFAPTEAREAEWGKYIQETVSRYASQVAAWEVWNEPDHDNFLKIGDGTWAKNHYPNESAVNQKRLEYKHLLELALAQPALAGKTLTTSGFAEGGKWDAGWRGWLAGQSGFLNRFDVASFHCYGYPLYQRLIDVPASYRATKAAIGKASWPFWITEHGINTIGVPAATVKTYLIRTYAVALAQEGVEKLFWFRAGYDPGHMDLFDASSKTTPAYDAFKTLTEKWVQPTRITPWSSGSARGSVATLASGKRVAIVWSEGSAAALNTLGLNVESASNQDGASVGLTSALSGAPIFLTLRD